MKILISPAKTIDLTKEIPSSKFTHPHFINDSKYLVDKLRKFSIKKIETMMHVSKELAELNHLRFQSWHDPVITTEEVRQAVFAFNGEVYRGLDIFNFTESQLEKAQQSIRILSGLYGILKPMDLIYPYRLEMGVKWSVTPKQKNLYQFWGQKLSTFLNEEMVKNEEIINLASSEYFKAIDLKTLNHRMITPVFKELKNGEYKVVMTYAKNARGDMANWIIKNNYQKAEEIKAFNQSGYSYSEHLSSENEWVFIR